MSNEGAPLPVKFTPPKNAIAVGLVAVGFGLITKHVLKKETLPVGCMGKAVVTFGLVALSSLVGEEAIFQAKTNEIIR